MKKLTGYLRSAFIGSVAHNAGLAVLLLHLMAAISAIAWPMLELLGKTTDDARMMMAVMIGLSLLFLVIGYFANRPELYDK